MALNHIYVCEDFMSGGCSKRHRRGTTAMYVCTGDVDTGTTRRGLDMMSGGVGQIMHPARASFSLYLAPISTLGVHIPGYIPGATLCWRPGRGTMMTRHYVIVAALGGTICHAAPPVSRGGSGTFAWFLSQVQT